MSFVSKGEKKMHNMAKAGKTGGERAPVKDSFGASGQRTKRNTAPASMDKEKTPVSEDAEGGMGYDAKTADSEFDPASGKRPKSIAQLRAIAKNFSEKSMAGEASPTGSEGGEDGKHTSTSKNDSGFMKGGGGSKQEQMSKKKPRAAADQMKDEMTDPYDEDEEDSGQTEEGMTPKGKPRKKNKMAMKLKEVDSEY